SYFLRVVLAAFLFLCLPRAASGATLSCGVYPLSQLGPGGDTVDCGGNWPFSYSQFQISQGSIIGTAPLVNSANTNVTIAQVGFPHSTYPGVALIFAPTSSGAWDVTGGAGYTLTITYTLGGDAYRYLSNEMALLSGTFSGGNSGMNVTVSIPGAANAVVSNASSDYCINLSGVSYSCGPIVGVRPAGRSVSIVAQISSGPGATGV